MLEDIIGGCDPVWSEKYPDPMAKNYWDMASHRIFYVNSEIDDTILELQKHIIEINYQDFGIEPENRKPIVIILNTPGGYLQETFSMCDTIIGSKTPVWTVNVGSAMSGGFLLLLAGHKRFTVKHAMAMVHSGGGGVSGTFEQQEAAQANYRKQVSQMREYILARTAIDEKTLKRNQAKDWYMDADEQVKYGVVDKVIEDLDEIVGAII